MSEPFRAPVESAPPPVEVKAEAQAPVTVEAPEDAPAQGYKESTGKYVSEVYLGLGELTGPEYANDLQAIDEIISYEIERGELKNSLEAAKARLKGIEKLLGINETTPTDSRVRQLVAYAKFLRETAPYRGRR